MKSLEFLIPSAVAEAIGATLMHSLWQLAAVALTLILVLALVPARAARLRYWLAVSSLGLMVLFPLGTFGLVYGPAVEPAAPAALSPGMAAQMAMQMTHASVRPPLATHATKSAGFIDSVSAFFQDNSYTFLGIWLLGMTVLLLRFLGSCWHVHRLRTHGTQEVPQDLVTRFVDLLDKVGIRRSVGIRYSKMVDTPMVIGALKPIVLLPMGLLSGLTMEQVECILIHELGHVRRWDYLVNMVQSVAEIILFYHPATWWVTRLIRQERENCCDELVVHLKSNKVQYARALLSLELLRQQAPALAMSAQGGDLASRIRRITDAPMPPKRRFHARGLLFGLISLGCVLLLASQSHTVVKAALPFFVDQNVDVPKPKSADVPLKKDVVTTVAGTGISSLGPVMNSLRLASMLGSMHFSSAPQDSPITKVTMIDNGEEVELRFNASGKIVGGTRNGVAIPDGELAGYQDVATQFFRGGTTALPPMSPMSPMPPLPALGAMPPMPPFDMPGSPGFNEKEFEKQMEKFGKQMEEWGQQYAKQFEGKDWDNYAKQMEQWGEQFGEDFGTRFGEDLGAIAGSISGAVDSPEWKAMQAEMEDLQGQLGNAKGKRERAALEEQIADLQGRMGDYQGAAIEEKMADFGARMEEWGERFAESMERMADMQASQADEEAARDDEEAARADEEATRADEEAARDDEDAARADEEAARADEEAARADEEGARAEEAASTVGEALEADGLIKNANSYKLKINNDEFYVDGKKQSKELHRKYRALLKRALDVEVGEDWVTIQHHRR